MDATEEEVQPQRRLDFELDGNRSNSLADNVDNEGVNSVHVNISERMLPVIGMEFETEDVAYEFYNAYAKEVGFSIRKSKSHNKMGKRVDRKFVCSCEGKRGPDKRDNVYKCHRPETRFGCLAKMQISCRHTPKYKVVKFVAAHNHNLASPSKSHMFRSHRRVSLSQAAEVEMADMSGIPPRNAFELMARQAGGRQNLGFVRADYNNYLKSKRTAEIRPGETRNLLGYLQEMQLDDPNFFYAIQVDEDDLITNIFWADAKMMSDYDCFGDVVCFDTTYRKHKDGRPIGLFVGVNHHRQTIIFGVALLYDETADSFIWLFDTFVKAMGGSLPKVMITDQDAAMSKALAYQWPDTCHRLCIWHIFQNAATHLSSVFERFTDFSTDFNSCVYDHDNEEDFLNAWYVMLNKYGVQDNDWLKRLFSIKEKWALVYGRDTFCADMITTQRSESMNKVIKHYVSSKHDLPRFFEHFQRLLDDRRYDELRADFKAGQSRITISMPTELSKHAALVYTPEVFTKFQAELTKAFDCVIESSHGGEIGEVVIYSVRHVKKHVGKSVTYSVGEEMVSCSCRKFEFAGILCCHILKTFSDKGIIRVPEKYILKRWTNDAKKGSAKVTSESSADLDPKTAITKRYKDLCRSWTQLATRAAETDKAYAYVKEGLNNLRIGVDSMGTQKSCVESCHVPTSNPSQVVSSSNIDRTVTSGFKIKPKHGSKSSKRLKSSLEKSSHCRKGKKKKLPGNDVQNIVSNSADRVTVQSQLGHLSQANIMNHPAQPMSLLPLLQHPQCDDYQAYAELLQSHE